MAKTIKKFRPDLEDEFIARFDKRVSDRGRARDRRNKNLRQSFEVGIVRDIF
jgi:hypothetical protein